MAHEPECLRHPKSPDIFDNTEDGSKMASMLQFPVALLSHIGTFLERVEAFALPNEDL
jgi:hypothetical protein